LTTLVWITMSLKVKGSSILSLAGQPKNLEEENYQGLFRLLRISAESSPELQELLRLNGFEILV
jgi:hypothetical protein